MHSNIYQISSKPICPDDYASPDMYYDNSSDFADYIGDAYEGEEREECIENFGRIISDVFTNKGDGVFEYKGKKAMHKFKQAWADELMRKAAELTPDNLFQDMRLFRLGQLTEKTHLGVASRVDINDLADGVANPHGELYEYADSQLKKGDCIYVGAVIDFRY